MKNTFVLKNIKNALNRTESEHENRERGKAENELKNIYETVREKKWSTQQSGKQIQFANKIEK